MANIFWNVTTSGNWTDANNWSPQVAPGPGDDAVLGVTGFNVVQAYTVSVSAAINPDSITISDALAALSVGDSVTVSVAHDVTSTGDIEVQNAASLVVSGNLSNVVSPQGAGLINVDSNSAGGGSIAVTGTLSNAGRINIGNGNLSAATTVTVGALQNTGSLYVTGNYTPGSANQATLNVLSAAPTNWTGFLNLGGDALVEFSQGSIQSIASGAEIRINTTTSFFADVGATTQNSALSGLTSNAGDFELQDAASASLSGDLSNTGAISLDTDTDYGLDPNGGSTLAIAGALVNPGRINIGNSNNNASVTVTAASLDNTGGAIYIVGDNAKGTQATLDIAGAAPTTLVGFIDLGGRDSHGGNALLEFGSGKITSIASGATLYLANPTSFVADADDLTHNSALTNLASIAGELDLHDAAAPVHVTGDLTNSGVIDLDANTDYGLDANGGSSLTIDGKLSNSGRIYVGNGILGASSLITAGSLDNTGGSITLVGDTAKGTYATLNILGAAPTTLTGFVDLGGRDSHGGDALLEFGSGKITTIASGAVLYLANPTSFVADSDDLTHNSALTGLANIDGELDLQDAAAEVHVTGDLTNTGAVNLDTNTDYGLDANGGSRLTIDGTLTNTNTLTVGNGALSAETIVMAGALANTGTINLYGGQAEAVLQVNSAAPTTWSGTLNFNVGSVLDQPSGPAALIYQSGSLQAISASGTINLWGQAYIADAATPNSNSALSELSSIAGTLSIDFGASVAIAGDLDVTGLLGVDEHQFDGFDNSGGSTLHIAGTLTNTAVVDLGNGVLSGPAALTAGQFVNAVGASLNLTGANGNVATFTVAAAAPTLWTGALNIAGGASLIYSGGSIQGIASGSSISLVGANSYIADANDTTHNSALTGLASNAGDLELQNAAAPVTISGDFGNTGNIGIDTNSYYGLNANGGSRLTIDGTFTNDGALSVGNGILGAESLVTVGALVNTGTINLTGGATEAVLQVNSAAPTTWDGTLNFNVGSVLDQPSGPAELIYQSGSLHTIAATGAIYLWGQAYVADAATPNSNSALSGLNSIAGTLSVDFGNSVSVGGDLVVTGYLGVDEHQFDGFDNSGGSTMAIAGTLTNSANISVGNGVLASSDSFTAGAITNQAGANVYVTGSGAGSAKVTVTGLLDNAGTWNVATSSIESVGSLNNTGTMNLNGYPGLPSSFNVLGATSNANQMTVGANVAFGASGAFTDSGTLKVGGFLDIDDGLEVTSTGALLMQGGEILGASGVTLDAGATVSGNGTILTAVANNTTITATGGLLTLGGPLSGSGSLAVGTVSELELADPTGEAVDFGGHVGTLKLDQPGSYTGAISGLAQGDVIDLAGVRVTNAVVNGSTLTVTAGNQALSYQVSGAGLAGNSFALQDDQQGGTNLVLGPPGPTISGATKQTAFLGWPSVLGPLVVADPAIGASDVLTMTITAQYGILSGTAAGAGILAGSGSGKLTLTGTLADINTMLAAVTYGGASAGQMDNVQVAVKDASNAVAAQTVAVTTDVVPFTAALLNVLTEYTFILNQQTALNGVSVSDPFAVATGQQISLEVLPRSKSFAITGSAIGGDGGQVSTKPDGSVTLTGTVEQINSHITDPLVFNAEALAVQIALLRTLTAAELAYLIRYTSFIQQNPDTDRNIITGIGFLYSQASAAIAEFGSVAAAAGLSSGAPAITTLDGQIYNFDLAGEFVLAVSKNPGDSFRIQIRLQRLPGSASSSLLTGVAVQLGADRVTFQLGRSDFVWIDGVATPSFNPAQPITLSGGSVAQIGPTTYQIVWNTGERLTIVDEGQFISLTTFIPGSDGSGSMAGLLGPGSGQNNDFTLPDGMVLQQPLSSADLYQKFANAWRVSESSALFDYANGQSTATFTDLNFPNQAMSLADLPANIVQAAAQAVAAAGITDAGAAAAIEFDYISTGGDPKVLASDVSLYQGVSTTPVNLKNSSSQTPVLGVFAPISSVTQTGGGVTDVTFDVYLTGTETTATVVDYAVISSDGDFTAGDFGGTLPVGSITIAAGQTTGTITISVPQGALGALPSKNVAVEISSPGGVPVFAPKSVETVAAATATAPAGNGSGSNRAVPQLEYLGSVGSFTHVGEDYTLKLGDIKYGQTEAVLSFAISNGATSPGDSLTGSFLWSTVAGFENSVSGNTASGTSLASPVSAGSSYQALTVTTIQNKFGAQSEVITFTPVDTNASGYSQQLSPITLTITDTLKVPDTIYSSAFGDVHILTYNGLQYDFQAVGEFTLAKSNVADDSFDIQLRLQPYSNSASVTYIEQVAASLGADRVTFGIPSFDRPASVLVDGQAINLTSANPTLTLAGGTITQVSPNLWKLAWSTGETLTVTEVTSIASGITFFDVDDSAPYASYGAISGLQGWNEGVENDFQLPDGTILQQPLSKADLYTTYANAWRVTQQSSLFDYAPGQTTATFTDTNFPPSAITLDDLPASVVAEAAALVAAAGITDPVTARSAELDYLATGDPSFIAADANINQFVSHTVAATFQPTSTAPAIGVAANAAKVTQAVSGQTAVTFTAYLTQAAATATTINYAVIASGDDLPASLFGAGATGSLTIAAGQTMAQFTIEVPDAALGVSPEKTLEVQVSSPGGVNPVFAPTAQTEIVNPTAEPGSPAVAQLAYLGNVGVFSFDAATHTYTLDLAGVPQGSALTAAQFAVINAAANGADKLAGSFTAPTGQGFIITGNNLASPLAGGEHYEGLYASANTVALGANGMTLTFNPLDVNDSGYSQALAPLTLKIIDSVVARAAPRVNTPTTIIFPAVHVGAVVSQHVSVTNTAVAGAANLDVSLSASGGATASGGVTGLAPGATDAAHLSVGIDTSKAGAISGSVTESFASEDGGTASAIAQEQPYIDVFGSVYRLADDSIAANPLTVHVNASGAHFLTITNIDPNDGYSEKLIATVIGTTGGVTATGTTGDIAAGDDATIAVHFSTATPGQIGAVTLHLQSDGGGVDGLGVTDLGIVTIPVVVTADNVPAAAQFEKISGAGTFVQKGAAYTLNLGVIAAPTTVSLGVLNSAVAPADALSGAFTVSGSSAFVNSGLAAFSGLASGQADSALSVTLNTGLAGTFSETITLRPVDATSGAALPVETLTITGEVDTPTPPPTITAPASAQVTLGGASAIGGVSVADSNVGATVTVTLTDANGLLAVTQSGASVVSGDNSRTLTLLGSVADVNADLATLTDADSASGPDLIYVTADDSFGGQATPATIIIQASGRAKTVTLAPVTGDNVLNHAEANAPGGVGLSGTVSGLDAGATFTVSVTDGAFSANYTATVDSMGAGWTATIPQTDASALSDGSATVTAVVDANTHAAQTVRIAEALPTVTIAAITGDNEINGAEALAGVALSGAVSGLAAGETFTVSVADGAFAKTYIATVNSAGTGWTATIPTADAVTLPEGTATVSTQVTDADGNVSAPATDEVTVAESGPSVTIAPVTGDNVINAAEANAAGGVPLSGSVKGLNAGDTFMVSVTDGAFAGSYIATVDSAGTGWTATLPHADAVMLPNGTASIATHVTDADGNVSPVASEAVTVARTPPMVTISTVAGDDVLSQTEATAGLALSGTSTGLAQGAHFNVTVADAGASYTYSAVVGASGVWSATMPQSDAEKLVNGTATVSAQATDAQGNNSPLATHTFTVAIAAPTLTISAVAADDVLNEAEASAAAGVALSGTSTGLAPGATFTIALRDNGKTEQLMAQVGAGGAWSAVISSAIAKGLADGTATLSAQATDVNGNVSATVLHTFKVAETLPTLTIRKVAGDDVLTSDEAKASGGVTLSGGSTGLASGATFTVHVADGGASHAYTATVGGGGAWTALIPSADAIAFAAGTATITAQATDAFGNVSALARHTFTVPTSGTAQGDVHLGAFDGMHYDFQATGEFVLAVSTNADNPFEVQVQESAWKGMTSVTTQVAVQVGADAVVFKLDGSVWVNGLAQPAGTASFAGGAVTRLSATSYEVAWSGGETLSIVNDTVNEYFNLSMSLPKSDGADSVEGLLGRNAGRASDFSLPDGTVIAQPMSETLLTGFYADAWRVTQADSLFNGPPTGAASVAAPTSTAVLSSGLSASRTGFADASYEVKTSGIAGEPYDGSQAFYDSGARIETELFSRDGLAYALENWNADGSVRSSVLLGAAGAPFGAASALDLEAFSSQALLGFHEDASQAFATLSVTDGDKSLTLRLAGDYQASEFALGSDGAGGAQLLFHAA